MKKLNVFLPLSVVLLSGSLFLATGLAESQSSWQSYIDQGNEAFEKEDYDQAAKYAEKAAVVAESETNAAEKDKHLAISYSNAGVAHNQLLHYDEAEKYLTQSLPLKEKVFGKNSIEYAITLDTLARLYQNKVEYAKAEPYFKQAIEIYRQKNHADIAGTMIALGSMYEEMGHLDKADSLYKEALAERTKRLGPDDSSIAVIYSNMARIDNKQKKYTEAEANIKKALAMDEKNFGPMSDDVTGDLSILGNTYVGMEKYDLAEPHFKRALEITEKSAEDVKKRNLPRDLGNLANIYQKQKKYDEAESMRKKVIALQEETLSPNSPYLADNYTNMGNLYQERKKYAEAINYYKKAMQIHENVTGPDGIPMIDANAYIAYAYLENHQEKESLPYLEKILALQSKNHIAIDRTNLGNLIAIYQFLNKPQEAQRIQKLYGKP